MLRLRLVPVLLAVVSMIAAGCGTSSGGADDGRGERLSVVASFYPLEEAARRVGGARVDVVGLTPAGSGPHDLELTPRSAEDIEQADVVVHLSMGFQPAVEQAVARLPGDVHVLDVLGGLDLLPVEEGLDGTRGEVDGEELDEGLDPHVWVDPRLQADIAEAIADVLGEADPAGAGEFRANLADYQRELGGLRADFEEGLADCESRVVVTSHRAFAYLAAAYDLEQIAIAGISPDEEPDPQSLQAVARAAEERGVGVVFFEAAVPRNLAETVAREIGASTDFLQPVETIAQDDLDRGLDYTAVQRRNLASLRAGLRCS